MDSANYSENEKRWLLLRYHLNEQLVEEAFKFMRAGGIEPILIKGWAASRKYPEKHLRIFGDIDLAVAPAVYEEAAALLEKSSLTIDLHEGLRRLDTIEWEALVRNSLLEKINETEIRILSEEDHLRVLCTHWLVDGGQYREKLWDIFYAVENRAENFCWNKCLNVVAPHRRRWIVCTIGLAHRYLGLPLDDLPFRAEASEIPQWLIKAVEREWAAAVPLRPLHRSLGERRELLRQIRKRIPPNPIQATVEMEGKFDESPRLKYQLGNVFRRIAPSIKRISKMIFLRKDT